MTKIYEVTVTVIDHEDCGAHGVMYALENTDYISVSVDNITEAIEVEWDDDHPLNQGNSPTYKEWVKTL